MMKGLEPLHITIIDFKSIASTNSATSKKKLLNRLTKNKIINRIKLYKKYKKHKKKKKKYKNYKKRLRWDSNP